MSTRASRRKPHDRHRPEPVGASHERKMKSLQSLQDRLCFTLKRPRSRLLRNSQRRSCAGYGTSKLPAGKPAAIMMESGLISIPLLHCDYYESPSPLSMSSSVEQDGAASATSTAAFTTPSCYTSINTTIATTASSSACSSITHVSHSPVDSSLDNNTSSDEGFSCDEVMSLVSCPDMEVVQNVLDFMPCSDDARLRPDTSEEAQGSRGRPPAGADVCEKEAATLDQGKLDYPSSVEEDGEPYRIDLCDFEPDVNALSSPPQEYGPTYYQKNYGGGVLSLRLDYDDVLATWKERGESLISREPICYPSPYLDHPFHIFGYTTPFVPHPPF